MFHFFSFRRGMADSPRALGWSWSQPRTQGSHSGDIGGSSTSSSMGHVATAPVWGNCGTSSWKGMSGVAARDEVAGGQLRLYQPLLILLLPIAMSTGSKGPGFCGKPFPTPGQSHQLPIAHLQPGRPDRAGLQAKSSLQAYVWYPNLKYFIRIFSKYFIRIIFQFKITFWLIFIN